MLCIVLLSLLVNPAKCQNKHFETKDWLSDFNFLADTIIEQSYGRQAVVKSFLGRDYAIKVEQLRNEMVTCNDSGKAVSILERLLRLTLDGHSRFVGMYEVTQLFPYLSKEEKTGLLACVDTTRKEPSKKLGSLLNKWKHRNSDINFYLYCKYENGNYLTYYPLQVNKKTIPIGAKIVKVDGLDIHQYVLNNLDKIPSVSYDYNLRRFFSEYFFYSFIYSDSTSHEINFSTDIDSSYSVIFDMKQYPKIIGYSMLSINLVDVKYFKEDRTLYIRLWDMKSSVKHLRKIRKFGSHKKIDRVVVDIRDNGGGNDVVWKEIFEELIDVGETQNRDVVVRNCSLSKTVLQLKDTSITRSFLGEDYIKLDTRMLETLIPSSTSISFKKKIILIFNGNIFSSAGSCAAVATNSDKFITVGTPVFKPIGVGVTPAYVMLPNSGLVVQIDLTMDITNAQKVEDLFLKPRVDIDQSIYNYGNWMSKFGNRWHWSYLKKNDPYYQRAVSVDIH